MNPLHWISVGFDVLGLRGVLTSSMEVPAVLVAVGIALLAGASTLLGHSAVLFINRVRGWRFAGSILLGGIFMALLYIAQGVLLWAIAPVITGTHVRLEVAAAVALASTAPLMLGLIELIPHLGILLGRILQGWSLLCLWGLTVSAYSATWWQGLLATALSWLAMQLASRLLSKPISWATNRVTRLVTGVTVVLQSGDILAGVPFVPVAEQQAEPEVTG